MAHADVTNENFFFRSLISMTPIVWVKNFCHYAYFEAKKYFNPVLIPLASCTPRVSDYRETKFEFQ